MANIINSIHSVFFKEGLFNYIRRKRNISFLNDRKLHTINYNGRKTKIYLNKKFGFVDLYIFEHGIYEKEIIDDIRQSLTKDMVMLDIGSNIGQHSLLLAPYCKEIYAFEPIPDVYQEFQKSINANHYKNVHLFNTAIGSKSEKKSFNYIMGHAGMSSFINMGGKEKSQITVNIEPLEKMVPNIHFDLVKMDVEGYEAVVILGNKEIFLKNRPVFFMEFCPSAIIDEGSHTPQELANFFFDNNFEVYSITLNKKITKGEEDSLVSDNWIVKPLN